MGVVRGKWEWSWGARVDERSLCGVAPRVDEVTPTWVPS